MHALYPGRKEQSGAAIDAAIPVFRKELLLILTSLKLKAFCRGILVLLFKLIINPETPNNPESKGNKGSLTGKLKVKYPKNPDNKKIINPINIFSSLNIKYKETKIKINGITPRIYPKTLSSTKTKIKLNIKDIGKAANPPYKVKTTASNPLPSFNISCPGKTERKLSSLGAPRNIEGIKSINVCVIDIATIKTTSPKLGTILK